MALLRSPEATKIEKDLAVGFGRCPVTDGWKHPRPGHEFPSYTVHDDLWATALVVLGAGKPVAALVSLDLGTLTRHPSDEIRALVAAKTGIPVGHLALHCTHTHASYSGYAVDPVFLAGCIAEAVTRAVGVASPAQVAHAARELGPGYNFNRRIALSDGLGTWCLMFNTDCRTEQGGVEAGAQLARETANYGAKWTDLEMSRHENWANGPIDSHLHVMTFLDAAGRTLGSVVRFAGHPVIVSHAWIGNQISRDAVGYVADMVAQATGAPCLYLTGCSGNLRLYCEKYTHVEAEKRGRLIGEQALALLSGLTFVPFQRFALAHDELTLDLWPGFPRSIAQQQQELARLQAALTAAPTEGKPPSLIKKLADDCARMKFVTQMFDHRLLTLDEAAAGRFKQPIAALDFGPACIVTFPCEPFHEIGLAVRARVGDALITAECVNGAHGYVPTPEEWTQGGYETTWCSSAPDTAPVYVDAATALLAKAREA